MFEVWTQVNWAPWLKTLQITILVIGALILRRIVTRRLVLWAQRTESLLDDSVVALLSRAVDPLLILSLLAAALNTLPLPQKFLAVANRMVYLAVLALVMYYAAQTALLLLDHWFAKDTARRAAYEPVRFVIRIVFAAFAVMILAENVGISLTAVWTTLGVGSIAVALALQDTLSNFFAGVYLRIDSPLQPGDYVKLQDGDEGFVTGLGWRSTRIRTLANNVVVVPNSRLASSILTNFSLPGPEMSVAIEVHVGQNADPDQVERILKDEASRAAGQVRGLLTLPPPEVRFIPGVTASSLGFTLLCRVASYVDQYVVQHELHKRILARCDQEGIPVSPQREARQFPRVPASRPTAPLNRQVS